MAPLRRIEDDLAREEAGLVALEIRHDEALRPEEAMAEGLVARRDAMRMSGRAELDLEGHQRAVEDGGDVAQRPDPALPA